VGACKFRCVVSPYDIERMFPGDGEAARLPRRQAVSTAQNMAITLVADYTLRTRGWLPATAIVALLGASGVSSASARTAISRLSRRGVLECRRDGRHSFYRLTPAAASDLSAGGAWIAGFATQTGPWDGLWTLVAFSYPQHEHGERRALRNQLRWLGFAPLYDALWASPDALSPTVTDRLTATAQGAITVFRARHVDLATQADRNPIDAWDTAAIAIQYETFIRQWRPLRARVRAGRVTGVAAVRARTQIMEGYRRFPLIDPQLPIELMPARWPRSRAREVFGAVYDGLAAKAQDHVRAVVTAVDASLARYVRAHTTSQMALPKSFR
jgi:phenylacetic acid degradation operon negative regulatory protein